MRHAALSLSLLLTACAAGPPDTSPRVCDLYRERAIAFRLAATQGTPLPDGLPLPLK